ncbi:21.9 kDa heat shock protein [Oryza glaberrima]|uniref:SHSP domain-containing protein n=2 Tax=Oryza TaxID=4527 RepID=A0A0D3HK16_9ORYZ|nr:21.9 kDa heat shock protein [Oryza glaberrima]
MAAVAERKVLGMVAAVAAMVVMMAPPAAALVPYGYGYMLDDPFRVLEQSPLRPAGGVAAAAAAGEPAAVALARCDWKETPEAHVVTVDVPGVRRGDVRVEVDEASRVLRVSGERRRAGAAEEEEGERDGVRWHRAERAAGRFWRRFRMPPGADVGRVAARLDDGVLTVTVPKVPGHRGREPRVVAIDGAGAGDMEAEVVKASKAEM